MGINNAGKYRAHSLVPGETCIRALEAADLAGVRAGLLGLLGQRLRRHRCRARRLGIDGLVIAHHVE